MGTNDFYCTFKSKMRHTMYVMFAWMQSRCFLGKFMQNKGFATLEDRLNLCFFEKQNPLAIPLGTEAVILEGLDS